MQALRVCYAFAFQGTAPRGTDTAVADLEHSVDAIENAELRDAVTRTLIVFDPSDHVCSTTPRAFDIGLSRSWADIFASVPPCSSAWRNLRLVLADLEGENLADLCRRLGLGYSAAYARQQRSLSVDWSNTLEVLGLLPEVISTVVDHGQETEKNQRSTDRLSMFQPYPSSDHNGPDHENVQQPDGLAFHPQHPEPGSSAHAEQGSAGFVLTPYPGGWRSK